MKTRRLTLSLALIGALILALALPALAAPSNDDITDATVVRTLPLDRNIDTRSATNEEFEANLAGGCEGGPGVWFRIDLDTTVDALAYIDGDNEAVGGLYEVQDGKPGALLACFRTVDGKPGSSDGNLYTFDPDTDYYLRMAGIGESTGVFSIKLGTALAISGTVKSSSGTPIPRTLIWAHDLNQRRVAAACSYADGKFRVSGLPAGQYRLRATASTCSIPEGGPDEVKGVERGTALWYKNATSFETATTVEVPTSGDLTGVRIVFDDGSKPSPSDPTEAPDGTASPGPAVSESPEPAASASDVASPPPTIDPSLAGKPSGEGTPWAAPLVLLLLMVPIVTFGYHRWWRARAEKSA